MAKKGEAQPKHTRMINGKAVQAGRGGEKKTDLKQLGQRSRQKQGLRSGLDALNESTGLYEVEMSDDMHGALEAAGFLPPESAADGNTGYQYKKEMSTTPLNSREVEMSTDLYDALGNAGFNMPDAQSVSSMGDLDTYSHAVSNVNFQDYRSIKKPITNIDRSLTEPDFPDMIPRIRAKLHEAVDLLSEGTKDPQHLALLDSIRKDTDAEEGMGRNRDKLASLSDELGYHKLSASIREI